MPTYVLINNDKISVFTTFKILCHTLKCYHLLADETGGMKHTYTLHVCSDENTDELNEYTYPYELTFTVVGENDYNVIIHRNAVNQHTYNFFTSNGLLGYSCATTPSHILQMVKSKRDMVHM
jgi:hypothetical protein